MPGQSVVSHKPMVRFVEGLVAAGKAPSWLAEKQLSCTIIRLYKQSSSIYKFCTPCANIFSASNYIMTARGSGSNPQAIFFTQSHQRNAPRQSYLPERDSNNDSQTIGSKAKVCLQDTESTLESSSSSRVACLVKFVLLFLFMRWFVRYLEIDRCLRKEPDTPHISMVWMWLALVSSSPFVGVYLYASVWCRRVRGEPLDLQNWQADCSTIVHVATIGLLVSWVFAFVALYPGFGLLSVVIVVVCTVCIAAMVDAVDGFF